MELEMTWALYRDLRETAESVYVCTIYLISTEICDDV